MNLHFGFINFIFDLSYLCFIFEKFKLVHIKDNNRDLDIPIVIHLILFHSFYFVSSLVPSAFLIYDY